MIDAENINITNQTVEIQKPGKKWWLIFLVSFVTLLILAAAAGAAYVWYQIYIPADSNNSQISKLIVESGRSVKEIGASLRQENFIRSEFWFEIYIWYKKQQANLQAGQYALSPDMNIPEILQTITGGKVIPNEVQVTFPEGFTITQMKDRLLENGVPSGAALEEELIDGFQVQYKFLSGVAQENNFEGFLFPDTYRFKKDISRAEIVKKFLDNFDKKLTPEMREEISQQGKSIYQIVILASIVQQEALEEKEMSMIAGIFWNRLKLNILLQSDATINYATGKKARQVSADDLKIQSPYNTYLHAGLPPTPICNPGIEAIRAAIYPQQSDYLYFLHPLNSPAVYSKTLEEHNKNKAKYL